MLDAKLPTMQLKPAACHTCSESLQVLGRPGLCFCHVSCLAISTPLIMRFLTLQRGRVPLFWGSLLLSWSFDRCDGYTVHCRPLLLSDSAELLVALLLLLICRRNSQGSDLFAVSLTVLVMEDMEAGDNYQYCQTSMATWHSHRGKP